MDRHTTRHALTDGFERLRRVQDRWDSLVVQQQFFHVVSISGPREHGFSDEITPVPAIAWWGCAASRAEADAIVQTRVDHDMAQMYGDYKQIWERRNRRRVAKGKRLLPYVETERHGLCCYYVIPDRTNFLWPPAEQFDFQACVDRDNIQEYLEWYVNELQSEGRQVNERVESVRDHKPLQLPEDWEQTDPFPDQMEIFNRIAVGSETLDDEGEGAGAGEGEKCGGHHWRDERPRGRRCPEGRYGREVRKAGKELSGCLRTGDCRCKTSILYDHDRLSLWTIHAKETTTILVPH